MKKVLLGASVLIALLSFGQISSRVTIPAASIADCVTSNDTTYTKKDTTISVSTIVKDSSINYTTTTTITKTVKVHDTVSVPKHDTLYAVPKITQYLFTNIKP